MTNVSHRFGIALGIAGLRAMSLLASNMFELMKYGVGKIARKETQSRMPAYEGQLTDSEIIPVLSFIKSRWPVNVRKRHDQLNALSQQTRRTR